MAIGRFLSIGLNSVDPAAYGGWSGKLQACEADAKDVALIARSMQHEGSLLLTGQATRHAVAGAIADAAATLNAGDLFLLFYSGHGGQLPDQNGDEADGLDETWCFFDGEFVDDEIYAALGQFKPGVRIFSMSDSCHSGTVLKAALLESARLVARPQPKAMPLDIALSVYEANRAKYDKILKSKKLKTAAQNIKASAILISGCMDNQLSADGVFNGLFTGQMKRVWNGGKFSGSYKDFWKTIVKAMPADQTPNYFTTGAPDAAFEASRPFAA